MHYIRIHIKSCTCTCICMLHMCPFFYIFIQCAADIPWLRFLRVKGLSTRASPIYYTQLTLKEARASLTLFSMKSSVMRREGCSLKTEFIRAIFAALRLASALVGQNCQTVKITCISCQMQSETQICQRLYGVQLERVCADLSFLSRGLQFASILGMLWLEFCKLELPFFFMLCYNTARSLMSNYHCLKI